MTRDDALGLDEALGDGDVSHAWSICSSAVLISFRVVLSLTGVLSGVDVPS